MFACLAKVVGCSNAGLILCLALTASAAFSGSSAGQSTIGSEANETNIIIQVQSSDGAPIPKAVVVFVGESSQAVLKGAAIEGGRERFQTDGEGRCSLPISATNVPVVTATEEGFCLMQTRDLPTHPILTVQPWACIEGVRLNRGKPLAYVGVSYDLSSQYQISMDADSLMHKGFEIPNSEAMTDLGGRFVFDHVPPSVVLIKESHFQTTGPMDRVDVKPGETNRITIATDGRSLAGRVEPAAGSTNRFNWAQGNGWLESDSSSAQALALPDIPAEFDTFESRGKWWRNWAGSTAARQRRDLITRQHTVEFHSDGSFAVDLVKPGTYRFTAGWDADGRRVALLDKTIQIPAPGTNDGDAPFDVGTFTVQAAANIQAGDAAPDFRVKLLDDKTLNLSDYRGKFVLLDFWATWCGPCRAEMPNMKSTWAAFGKDKRFAMVSLSLDSDTAAPRQYARDEGISWTQGFLGEWSKDKVTVSYGVFGIPAVFLIGPDGKVLATDLQGGKIKETVEAALTH